MEPELQKKVYQSFAFFCCYLLIVAVFVWSGSLAVAEGEDDFDFGSLFGLDGDDSLLNVDSEKVLDLNDGPVTLYGFDKGEFRRGFSNVKITSSDLELDLENLPQGVKSITYDDASGIITYGYGSDKSGSYGDPKTVSVQSGTINEKGEYITKEGVNRGVVFDLGDSGSALIDSDENIYFENGATVSFGDRDFVNSGDESSSVKIVGSNHFVVNNVDVKTNLASISIPESNTQLIFDNPDNIDGFDYSQDYVVLYGAKEGDTRSDITAKVNGENIDISLTGEKVNSVTLSVDGDDNLQNVKYYLDAESGLVHLTENGGVELKSVSAISEGKYAMEVDSKGVYFGDGEVPEGYEGRNLKLGEDGALSGSLEGIKKGDSISFTNLGDDDITISKELMALTSSDKEITLSKNDKVEFKVNSKTGKLETQVSQETQGNDDVGNQKVPELPIGDDEPTGDDDPDKKKPGDDDPDKKKPGDVPPGSPGGGCPPGGSGGGCPPGGSGGGGLFGGGGSGLMWLLLIGGGIAAALLLFGGGDDEESGEERPDDGDGEPTDPTDPTNPGDDDPQGCQCDETGCSYCPDDDCFACIGGGDGSTGLPAPDDDDSSDTSESDDDTNESVQ